MRGADNQSLEGRLAAKARATHQLGQGLEQLRVDLNASSEELAASKPDKLKHP